jgi:hypothetical protein
MPLTYEKISSTTLGTASATITLGSIPATYTDLKLVVVASTTGTSDYNVQLRFNGDSGSNYSRTGYDIGSANGYAFRNTGATFIDWVYAHGLNPTLSFFTYDIFSYAGNKFKPVLVNSSHNTTSSTATGLSRISGAWRSTSAITTLELSVPSTTFAIGSTATLYGIKAA